MILLCVTADAATVSGRFDHPLGDEVHIENARGETLAAAKVEDLAFRLEVPVEAFVRLTLKSGDKYVRELFLEPKDALELSVQLDEKHNYVKSVAFAGPGAERHQALAEFDALYRSNGGLDTRYNQAVPGSQQDFLAAEERVVRKQLRWIARHRALGEGLAGWLTEWSTLATLDRTVFYLMHHEIKTGEKVVPEGRLRDVLDALPPERPEVLDHPSYARLLDSVAYRWHLDSTKSGPERYREVWARIDAALDGEERELMRYSYLDHVLDYADTEADLETLAELVAQTGGAAHRTEALQEALDLRMMLAPGRPAPDFTLPDREGRDISLSSFAGSVVVLDFWGTWCGPCIEALPAMAALQEEFADLPVAFVFVALEVGRRPQWLKFLDSHALTTGTHLYAEGQFRCPQLKRWGLSGAPTYVVLDAEGRIVTSDAPPPGDGLAELLRETLRRTAP